MKNFRYTIFFALVFALFSCEADIEQYAPQAGDADFSTYVALGSSLTAGFADNDVYRQGQINAYPNILATQLAFVGRTGDFKQPLMKDELGFGNRLVLGISAGGLAPVPAPGTPDPGNFSSIAAEGPFHNLGVPGAHTAHLLFPGYGTLNPYYGRFASNPGSSSIIGEALALQPSFFSLWVGNNEVLAYAVQGGVGAGITPVEEFQTFYAALLQQLTPNAKGVLANIPDISSIPFFRTIPYNALALSETQATMLNAAYAMAPHISFAAGPNGFVVVDSSHPAGIRQLQAGELVLLTLPLDRVYNEGWGSQVPIPEQYYLSVGQVANIHQAVNSYNSVISALAVQFDLALVDINQLLQNGETGMYFDALAFNTEFVTGGVFSLDGVHLSPRGNAIVANAFIEAINVKYGASIPKVPVGQFPGIVFPG